MLPHQRLSASEGPRAFGGAQVWLLPQSVSSSLALTWRSSVTCLNRGCPFVTFQAVARGNLLAFSVVEAKHVTITLMVFDSTTYGAIGLTQ